MPGCHRPVAVVGPRLRQVQLAVEQGVEAVAGVGEVDRDDAVLLLAGGSAPLPLHAGGLVPLLDVAGLVDDPDGAGAGVLVADGLPDPVARPVFIPLVPAEELLQGPRRHTGVDRDRLDALLGDVRELPGDVHGQVGAGVLAGEAVVEPLEELLQFGPETPHLPHVHARPPVSREGEPTFAAAGGSRRINFAL